MKRISVLLPAAFLLAFTYSCKPGTNEENKVTDTSYALIPQPVEIGYSPGHFTITENTGIFCPIKLEETALLAAEQLGIKQPVNTDRKRNGIFLSVDTTLHREGYNVKVGRRRIEITGGSNTGVFYAIQTLYQLSGSDGLPSDVPCVIINDYPRFIWRGLQANFWSHIDREPELVDKQIFPRLLSIAERGWSPLNVTDWESFRNRLEKHLPVLQQMGINYFKDDI